MASAVKALVAFMAVAAAAELVTGKTYTIKWDVGGNYGDWSSTNKVAVGDTVVFTYGSSHTVDEMSSEADYKACNFGSPGPVSTDSSGNTSFTFDAAGTRYFACATGSHCTQGQKVAITVADGGSRVAPAPAPPSLGTAPSATPKTSSATANTAEIVVKLVLGLAVGGAML